MENLKTALKIKLKGAQRTVLLGVGSELRGDDIAGLLIAEALKDNPALTVINGGTAPENFTGEIKKIQPTHLIIVDSAEMQKEPGFVKLIDVEEVSGYSFSTHSLPMKVMTDYLLKYFPCEIIIIGIQPKSLGFGEEPSQAVKAAAREVAGAILASLRQ
jgi:hydrogenase 3 maturation protease